MYKKILLPIDGSIYSKKAIKHAIEVADIEGSEIILLNVIEEFYTQTGVLPISNLPDPHDSHYEELENQAKMIIEKTKTDIQESCLEKCGNITITSMISIGKPYLEILKIIDKLDVDMVVMGASGKHGLDRVILGSVTERVTRESEKPVLIIP